METSRKGIIGITLALIMITSTFAAIAPITADVQSQDVHVQAYSHAEKIADRGNKTYYLGEVVTYLIKVYNDDPNHTITFNVTDTYAHDAPVQIATNVNVAIGGNWSTTYPKTIAVGDLTNIGGVNHVFNGIFANGTVDGTLLSFTASVDEDIIILEPPPEIDFSFNGTDCNEVTFNAWAVTDGINNWAWDFGSGESPASGTASFPITVKHTFNSCGSKTVKLTACRDALCANVTKTVNVACGPTAVAVNYPTCFEINGTDITFDGSGSTGTSMPLSYKWNFTGGFTGDNDNGAITTVTGVNAPVTATLTVTDALNCTSTAGVSVGPCSGCSLRLYGTFGEGAGDDNVKDNDTGLSPENWPYTDPVGPFYPQHWQAPRKDFITFNPAMMDHNQNYSELSFRFCNGTDVQREKEKVFKRMWYQKEWFKDHDKDGCWDVVIEDANGKYVKTLCLDDSDAIHAEFMKGNRIRIWNNEPAINDSNVDIYGPAIVQEFTYLFADEETMPTMIHNGSHVLIPMASWVDGNGIDSFDADHDGVRDYLIVTSEQVLAKEWHRDRWGVDIDKDGNGFEPMDGDGKELSGDETLVLMLDEKTLEIGDVLQLFDNKVELTGVFGPSERSVTILVSDNEGGGSTRSKEVTMKEGDIEYFYRGQQDQVPGTTFFVRVVAIGWDPDTVRVQIGRMFGKPYANIGANIYWNQKAFIVDNVFYNVVAIKAQDNCVKFITFRQKLPKMPIKLYGKHLKVWEPFMVLPEMPPFNENHEVLVDVKPGWPASPPQSQQAKIGVKVPRPPLVIDYIDEDHEWRYWGQLKEIYDESLVNENTNYGANNLDHDEHWDLEWFWTQPWQYTEFRLPKDDDYLVTLSWLAYQAEGVLWDHNTTAPAAVLEGGRFKFWYRDCTGPIYIDNGTLRLYGAFDNGPGDHEAIDPQTSLYPENKPYTDPMGPFFPQSLQAPHKDFVTFNPAMMDHNQGYPELSFRFCNDLDVQREKEKVFKRMWYEKEWFKDHDKDGQWDVVLDDGSGKTMTLADWMKLPVWQRPPIKEYNNIESINDSNVDIYAPAINQEFTYMFLDEETMPIMINGGSRVLIPMASKVANNGIDSFDADGDGARDYLIVTSEQLLSREWYRRVDIDGDGISCPAPGNAGVKVGEPMDCDGKELSGDETLVLMLPEKSLSLGQELQLFDHRVRLDLIYGPDDRSVDLTVSSNENAPSTLQNPRSTSVNMKAGDIQYFYRGQQDNDPYNTFFVRVIAINWLPNGTGQVRLQVGRLFGQTFANIGANPYWSQKAFIVDGVFYNVVAIKAQDNCIKYITFRQKLPKEDIKLYGTHLLKWDPDTILPEMPPFNEDHEIMIDVMKIQTQPHSQQDKIGVKEPRGPLNITYKEEDIEERFKGHLKEIYNETFTEGLENEYWNEEWFWTKPWQYTSFVLPDDQLYLVTLAWYAPEACNHIWDGGSSETKEPEEVLEGSRVKFWYDQADNTDLYVNRLGELPGPLTLAEHFDRATYGGNGNGKIDLMELVNAILAYLNTVYPFGTGGMYDKGDLLDLLQAYINQQ
jgi:hypothetical protein